MNPNVKIGDQVRLVNAYFPAERKFNGRIGTVVEFSTNGDGDRPLISSTGTTRAEPSKKNEPDYVYAYAAQWDWPTAPQEGLTLDPKDPFESVVIQIVETNRKKRGDYATEQDIFVNFRRSAEFVGVEGFGPVQAVLHNIGQKLARLEALKENGKMAEPNNESVNDTYLDLAVYLIILQAIQKENEA